MIFSYLFLDEIFIYFWYLFLKKISINSIINKIIFFVIPRFLFKQKKNANHPADYFDLVITFCVTINVSLLV